jgi:hypothetical protein
MPTICPHCHTLVSDQPTCSYCGKRLQAPADSREIDRALMFSLMRYALLWVLGIAGVGFVCMFLLYILLR